MGKRRSWWQKVWDYVSGKPPVVEVPPAPEPAPVPIPLPPTTTKVVFRDDFTDLRNWKLYDSVGHDGQGLRKPSQISVINGVLTIIGTSSGTTGGMSLISHDVYHGAVSVRLRTPQGAGKYHPVALLWGLGSGSAVDAVTGEIDFVEFWNRPDRDLNGFSLHYGDGTKMLNGETRVDGTGWHTYTVTWTPTEIIASIDDVPYFRTTDATKFPKNPMELCLQLDWFPNENTTSGTGIMEVDWVEIRSL